MSKDKKPKQHSVLQSIKDEAFESRKTNDLVKYSQHLEEISRKMGFVSWREATSTYKGLGDLIAKYQIKDFPDQLDLKLRRVAIDKNVEEFFQVAVQYAHKGSFWAVYNILDRAPMPTLFKILLGSNEYDYYMHRLYLNAKAKKLPPKNYGFQAVEKTCIENKLEPLEIRDLIGVIEEIAEKYDPAMFSQENLLDTLKKSGMAFKVVEDS